MPFVTTYLTREEMNKLKRIAGRTGTTRYRVTKILIQSGLEDIEICRRLGLEPTRRIIVYTNESLPPSESEAIVHAIHKALNELSAPKPTKSFRVSTNRLDA